MKEDSYIADKKTYYAALKAHDTRFDGKFYVAVSSTGIYCRPVCRVKTPKADNCSYYTTAAAAEAAGFRPCLKCRPELAPGLSSIDAVRRIADKAALIIENGCLPDSNLSELAKMLNITDRHLRRVFIAEFGVSPVQYLQTQRLLLAKGLLTDTQLPVTDIALTAGFGSIRRFNDLFIKQYKLTPTQLRREGVQAKVSSKQSITLRLGYRPPYEWAKLLSFLKTREIEGVESISGSVYRRTVTINSGKTYKRGWLSVENDAEKNALSVTVSYSLLPVISKVLARIRILFDVNCEPDEIYEKLSVMNELSAGLCIPGIRLPGAFDAYEAAVRAVLGQQITVQAARTLAGRLVKTLGEKISTPYPELTHTFPTAEKIRDIKNSVTNMLGAAGIISRRAGTILHLAEAMLDGTVTFCQYSDVQTEMEKMMAIPGIGPWTAQYIAMRAFGWPDIILHTDYGVKKALKGMTEKEILQISEKWRPWRSYATINLWNSV